MLEALLMDRSDGSSLLTSYLVGVAVERGIMYLHAVLRSCHVLGGSGSGSLKSRSQLQVTVGRPELGIKERQRLQTFLLFLIVKLSISVFKF